MDEITQVLSDDEMVTSMPVVTAVTEQPGPKDADGTDGDTTDGTDGDSSDSDGTDAQDADGTDGQDSDGTDAPA